MRDGPGWILAATIVTYWGGVGVMIGRAWRERRRAGVVPRIPLEQALWIFWVPAVAAWLALPIWALQRPFAGWDPPSWLIGWRYYTGLRWVAALTSLTCLLGTFRAWTDLGRQWSLGTLPDQASCLVTRGLYSRVRHPIYGLGLILAASSVLLLPIAPMMVAAAVHGISVLVKAAQEERVLRKRFGREYEDYCRQTGAFAPRWSGRD